MGPSFLTFHDGALWFGRFARAADRAPRLYRVPADKVFGTDSASSLQPHAATHSLPIPLLVQGVVFDAQDRLWLSASGQKEGWLHRVAVDDGRVLASHRMPAGIEGLAVTAAGEMWAVSECGSRRWLGSATFYPLLFEIDPVRLVEAAR
jgi:hypothetical protein